MAPIAPFTICHWCFAASCPEWMFSGLSAVVSGAASMLLYARCSPQKQLKDLKAESAAIHQQMTHYVGDFAGAMILIRRNLLLSVRRLGCALPPSLLGSLPVLLALLVITDHYVLFFITAAVSALLSKLILHIT